MNTLRHALDLGRPLYPCGIVSLETLTRHRAGIWTDVFGCWKLSTRRFRLLDAARPSSLIAWLCLGARCWRLELSVLFRLLSTNKIRSNMAKDTYRHTWFVLAHVRQVARPKHIAAYLRCAFLQGTQAEATCPFVFLCDLGEAKDCWLSCVGGRVVTALYPGTGPEVGIGAGAGRYGCCWVSIWL